MAHASGNQKHLAVDSNVLAAYVDAAEILTEILDDSHVLFLNQTKDTTKTGLKFADRYGLGGRDALILANFINPSVAEFITFDKELIRLRRVEHGRSKLMIHAA